MCQKTPILFNTYVCVDILTTCPMLGSYPRHFLAALLLFSAATASPSQQPADAKRPPMVERLGPTSLRIGQIHVDQARREVTVPGHANNVRTLEFLANTVGGM